MSGPGIGGWVDAGAGGSGSWAGHARPGPVARSSGPRSGRRGAALLAGCALVAAADLVLAGAMWAAVFGPGWRWPAPGALLAAAAGSLAHPGHPGQGWSPALRPGPGPVAYWSVLAALVVLEGAGVLAGRMALMRSSLVPRSGYRALFPGVAGPGRTGEARRSFADRDKSPRLSRRSGAARPVRGRALGSLGRRTVVADTRDRHGFAGRRQLRREASVSAARERAAQTRPSLAGARRRLRPEEVGYPLGRAQPQRTELWPSWESSLRLVAPPGEGKTFRALAPILRQHPGPALATSTKPDLYELTALARLRRGPVVALDPDSLVPAAPGARWSPVAGCERSEVAERRASALVAATGDDGDVQNGAFFRDSARDLLKAYLHAAALEGLDIRAVLDWSRRPEDTTAAEVLASSAFAAPGWADLIELHTTGAAETTSGVLRYLARALSCFSHESVVEACCPPPGEELDIEQLLLGNGTVYLLGKGSRLGAVAPLITALADEVFDCAERLAARMPTRRLDPPLLGLLDEAPSIAPLPSLPELLADGRGRGIVLVYAMQSFSQAVTRWGARRAETMANATSITAVLGGLSSPADLSDLERICGQRRVRRESTHRGAAPGGGRDHSRTFSWESEAVLRADQIRTLPAGMALVLWSRLPPVLSRLPLLSERPEWPEVRGEEAQSRRANDAARWAGGRVRAWAGPCPASLLPAAAADPPLTAPLPITAPQTPRK